MEQNKLLVAVWQRTHADLSQERVDAQILECRAHFLGAVVLDIDRGIIDIADTTSNDDFANYRRV